MATGLHGTKELSTKLSRLGSSLGTKTLRSAALKSTTPVVRKMRNKAPVGNEAHRTFKGRLVAPGFLKRSIRKKSRIDRATGKVSVVIGVLAEAFYGIAFLDKGVNVTSRGKRSIKPYTIRGRNWFKSVFIQNRNVIESTMIKKLKESIDKVTRG